MSAARSVADTPRPAGSPSTEDVTVLIIDDHRMFAEAITLVLEDEDGISVLAVAHRGDEGIVLAARHKPQVVLLDHNLPDQDGVTTARAIRQGDPATAVVMLTASTDERVVRDAIDAGCTGYLTKDRAGGEVVHAVRAAAAGESLLSPALLARLLPHARERRAALGADLTERETTVLSLLAAGVSNRAIADQLYLSVNTIRNHVQSIIRKLGAHSKLEAVATAMRVGVIV